MKSHVAFFSLNWFYLFGGCFVIMSTHTYIYTYTHTHIYMYDYNLCIAMIWTRTWDEFSVAMGQILGLRARAAHLSPTSVSALHHFWYSPSPIWCFIESIWSKNHNNNLGQKAALLGSQISQFLELVLLIPSLDISGYNQSLDHIRATSDGWF